MAARETLEQTRPTGNGRARGLVSSRSSGRRIDAARYAPPEDLADVVETLWTGRWDLRGQTPHVTELLGDPCAHFVFERGGEQAGGRLVGVWTRLWRRELKDRGYVRGVKLRAGALRAFLAAPAHHFANCIRPLAELFPDAALAEMAVLDAFDDVEGLPELAAWLRPHRRDDPDTSLAVAVAQRIAHDPSMITVAHLASVAGLGERALQRLFRDHLGAPPKWVIRRHRLQEAAVRIERGDAPSLAALAAELGYADQAHLARDFKRAVGKSPSALRASLTDLHP